MDLTYLIFVMPFVILSMIASAKVKSTFAKYDKIRSKKGITGQKAASILLWSNDIHDVTVHPIRGQLTDNYNPGNKTLNLSDSTFASESIAAIGVAAHETGHAIQHNRGYAPLAMRSFVYPAANIGSRFGPMMAILGIIFGYSAKSADTFALAQLVTNIGLILFAVSVAFYIITLPVEFNASRRALKILRETRTLDEEELRGARAVLTAAAMTYVAAALTAIGSLLRLLVLTRRRR